jgi:hypothetical protein
MTRPADRVHQLADLVQLAKARGAHGIDARDVRRTTGVPRWPSQQMLRTLVTWGQLRLAGLRPTEGRPGRRFRVYVHPSVST